MMHIMIKGGRERDSTQRLVLALRDTVPCWSNQQRITC